MNIDNYIASSTVQNSFMNLTGLDFNSITQWSKELAQMLTGQIFVILGGYVDWVVAILAVFMVITLSIKGFQFFKH